MSSASYLPMVCTFAVSFTRNDLYDSTGKVLTGLRYVANLAILSTSTSSDHQ